MTETPFSDLMNRNAIYSDTTEYDESGNYATRYVILGAKDFDTAKAWAEDNVPAKRCQHEWDCCGQWYRHKPTVSRTEYQSIFIIRSEEYMNV